MVPLRRVTVNRHVTPLAAGSTATVPVNLQTILSIRYKTGRILSCIYRNQSHLLLICGQDNYVVQRNLAIGITAFNNFLRHISSEVWVDIVPHVVPLVRRAQKIGGTPQCLMVVSCTSRPGLLRAVVWSKL